MANTNSFEGLHFVNPANPLPLDIYVKNLFPTLSKADIQRAVELYGSIREDTSGNETLTLTNQAIAVYGEGENISFCQIELRRCEYPRPAAILICPTYWLLQAFDGKAYKVRSFNHETRGFSHS
jgi:hypothetical protein